MALTGKDRPLAASRANVPISIDKPSFDPVECPVLGEQIDIITASLRSTRDTKKIKRTAETIYIAAIHRKLINRYELLNQEPQDSQI
jgi:hypothetical protein